MKLLARETLSMEENVMIKVHVLAMLVTGAILSATVPFAMSAAATDAEYQKRAFAARLHGFNEVPSVSTAGHGRFAAVLSEDGESLTFRLTLAGLSTPVTQAHIHFGASKTNGGVMVFLCQTPLAADPAILAPPCRDDGTTSGTITAANVIGPRGQGITRGEFREFIRALRARSGYVNVHTVRIPSGEVRGQIRLEP